MGSNRIAAALAATAVAIGIAACGGDDGDSGSGSNPGAGLPQGSEAVSLDPADFTTAIDNPYWPMKPGSRWIYREAENGDVQKVVVTVTDRTKRIANGIEARVVHDVVSAGGEPVEVTDDYYAQDGQGNVWYLGERTAEYENGKVTSRHGSFEAGVDGAQAGIALPADPQVGMTYRQEYYAGQAEDKAKVLGIDEQAEVPFGHFSGALMTKDLNPLEPRLVELKFYARSVGPVMTLDASGASGREELLSYSPGG